jgi:hypothetical protein
VVAGDKRYACVLVMLVMLVMLVLQPERTSGPFLAPPPAGAQNAEGGVTSALLVRVREQSAAEADSTRPLL